ncbi:hypothetical protein [Paraburkholderia fungorum]|uniref:hypothetical protein n=1 Tax=Paraburkholderia fungorum TaxID=134537 RepID=UPI0038B8F8AF
MPIDQEYVSNVLGVYQAGAGRMGEFPQPSREVVIAAEVLKQHIVRTSTSAAVEVVEIGSEAVRKYVIATSGKPDALNETDNGQPFDLAAANRDLTAELRALNIHVEFIYANQAYELYQPMHKDAIGAIKKASPTFDGAVRKVQLQDVQGLFQQVTALIDASGLAGPQLPVGAQINRSQRAVVHGHQKKQAAVRQAQHGSAIADLVNQANHRITLFDQIRTSKELSADQLQALIGVCLALRLNAVESAHRMAVRSALDTLLNAMSAAGALRIRTAIDHLYNEMPRQLNAIAGKNEDRPPPLGDSVMDRMIGKIWDTLTRSRYCAEPRAFAYLSKQSLDTRTVVVRSQVCFWWGGTGANPRPNPPEYQVIGPASAPGSGALAGSYMWPCTSCKNRSAEMLRGLGISAAARTRRLSFSL